MKKYRFGKSFHLLEVEIITNNEMSFTDGSTLSIEVDGVHRFCFNSRETAYKCLSLSIHEIANSLKTENEEIKRWFSYMDKRIDRFVCFADFVLDRDFLSSGAKIHLKLVRAKMGEVNDENYELIGHEIIEEKPIIDLNERDIDEALDTFEAVNAYMKELQDNRQDNK